MDNHTSDPITPSRHPIGRGADYEDYKSLLDSGYDPMRLDLYQYTLIHHAAAHGQPGALDAFVDHGISITHVVNGYEVTPLHTAVGYANPAHVKELIALGADVNAQDLSGKTPLHCAASIGPLKANGSRDRAVCTELLLAAGANPGISSCIFGWPVDVAVEDGSAMVVSLLLHALPPDQQRLNDLIVAAINRKAVDIVEMVALAGADLQHRVNGRTLRQITKDPEIKRLINSLNIATQIESAMKGGSDTLTPPGNKRLFGDTPSL